MILNSTQRFCISEAIYTYDVESDSSHSVCYFFPGSLGWTAPDFELLVALTGEEEILGPLRWEGRDSGTRHLGMNGSATVLQLAESNDL